MDEDEIAAVHEAAHAVFAALGRWTRIHGPVSLKGHGAGDIRMSTDVAAISRTVGSNPRFDRNLPRLQLIRALLAGPVAEKVLVDHGRARLSEALLIEAGEGDYRNVIDQLDKLDPPRRDLLPRLEIEVREALERPAVWTTVEQFAAVLLERRVMDPTEASAAIERIAADAGLSKPDSKPAGKEIVCALLAGLTAALFIWSGSAAPFPLAVLIGGCVASFMLGFVWSLRRPKRRGPLG